MMRTISAFHTAGGVQINEVGHDETRIFCRMVWPQDEDWERATALTEAEPVARSYYDPATRRIVKVISGVGDGIFDGAPDLPFVDGVFERDRWFLSGNSLREIPPCPDPLLTFDAPNEAWVDARSEADWIAAAIARREGLVLSRLDFVLSCLSAGLISAAEAEIAAVGGLPPSFADLIEDMPEALRLEARLRWMGATIIGRTDTLVAQIAFALGVSDWSLDRIFGLDWPPPLPGWPEGQIHPQP